MKWLGFMLYVAFGGVLALFGITAIGETWWKFFILLGLVMAIDIVSRLRGLED